MTTNSTIITAAEAIARLGEGADPVILDASLDLATPRFDGDYRANSGREAWLAARIPGSQHIDLLHQWIEASAPYHFAAPGPESFTKELAKAGIDGTRPVWLYDRTNLMWAARLWWTLRNAGIPALVIDGGLRSWEASGGSIASGEPTETVQAVLGPPAIDAGLWANRGEVESILAGVAPDDPILICALSTDAMWGRVPTRYSRRGHIPGSLNLAGHALLDPNGSLLNGPGPAGVSGVALDRDQPVVIYCGGGISASLTALALVHWGATRVRIYDGSLEEWSAVPELDLVRA
jgi:thiosulfate/3-mercaptopyruvate sulfurtransferase